MVEAKIDTDKKIFFVVVLLLLIFGINRAYAYFSAKSTTSTQTVNTASFDLKVENNAIINAENIVPIKNVDVLDKATKLDFTITNTGTTDFVSIIKLDIINMDTELKSESFKWALYEGAEKITDGNFLDVTDSITLSSDIEIKKTISKNYILYIWIEDIGEAQNELQNKNFKGQITVSAKQ